MKTWGCSMSLRCLMQHRQFESYFFVSQHQDGKNDFLGDPQNPWSKSEKVKLLGSNWTFNTKYQILYSNWFALIYSSQISQVKEKLKLLPPRNLTTKYPERRHVWTPEIHPSSFLVSILNFGGVILSEKAAQKVSKNMAIVMCCLPYLLPSKMYSS